MNTIAKHLIVLILCVVVGKIQAQDTIQKADNNYKIERLKSLKEAVENEEREALKIEVENINKKLAANEISKEEAEKLKKEAAQNRALNIENRLAIIDNKIALLKRNQSVDDASEGTSFVISIGKNQEADEYDRGSVYIGEEKEYKRKPKVYDKRTKSDLVFAIGFNNAVIEGQALNDSPYKFGGSGFVELGWAWKTRVFKNTNALRLKYGFSLQWNKLDIKDDLYFVEDESGNVSLQEFSGNVKKSKFRTTNLVVPVHFEFGPSKKIEKEDYFRYSTYRKLKIGLGGYAGFNIGSMQKVKYKSDGKREKDKYKNYNTNNLVYGLSAYVGFGNMGVYAKYDLSPIFKDQIVDQNNISLGFRFDLD